MGRADFGRVSGRGRAWAIGCVMAVASVGSLTGCGQGGGSPQKLLSSVASAATSPAASVTAPAPPAATSAMSAAPAAPTLSGATGCSLTTYSPNFGAENDPASGLPNQLYHWNALPAQVYFVPSDYLTADRKAQALAGFDWWALATGQPFLYQETAQRGGASIVVQCEARGETGYGAITEYHFNSKQQMLDATITFNMTYLTAVASIVPVAAHEFGHALGIAGHSNDAGDVMSSTPGVYDKTQLSTRDINTMQTAYCGLPILNGGGASGGASKNTAHNATGAVASSMMVSCRFDGQGRAVRRSQK